MVNHLHRRNLLVQLIGRRLRPVHSFKRQNFYLSVQRCRPGTLMSSWTSGRLGLQHQVLKHHSKTTDLYDTIDATPIGGVPWQRFEMSFNGSRPETNVPQWMEQTYEVYFRDPRQLLLNMLADPTFAKDFDYTPMQQFDGHGSRHYENFMSGDWAWVQAVRLLFLEKLSH